MKDSNTDLFGEVLAEISTQVSEISDGDIRIEDTSKTFSDMGVSSVNLLSLLVALENTFGIEWSVDTPTEVFSSPESLGRYVEAQLGG